MIAAHIRYIQRVDEYIVRYRKNYKVSLISQVCRGCCWGRHSGCLWLSNRCCAVSPLPPSPSPSLSLSPLPPSKYMYISFFLSSPLPFLPLNVHVHAHISYSVFLLKYQNFRSFLKSFQAQKEENWSVHVHVCTCMYLYTHVAGPLPCRS